MPNRLSYAEWQAVWCPTSDANPGLSISVRTVGRQLLHLGLDRRRFFDPTGLSNRLPRRILARWPGHMILLDVKKTGQTPDGGGWRVHDGARRDGPVLLSEMGQLRSAA